MENWILNLCSGLVGAILGALSTYYAALKQQEIEHKARLRGALLSVMLEICRNQSTLFRELDRILPLWLARKRVLRENSRMLGARLKYHTRHGLPHYHMKIYEHFFGELISSMYGPEIERYYKGIKYLNILSDDYYECGLSDDVFMEYTEALSFSIRLAEDLVKALGRDLGSETTKQWNRDRDIKNFSENSLSCLIRAALYDTSLEDIETYVDGEGDGNPSTVGEILRANKNILLTYKAEAENEVPIALGGYY